ncbi:MAG TPA: LysM peptidoglycan-binding domain-containing protein, partial [Anaerolineales bacterium]|nr:LysM peptidoglycan-binding domain-containing protein [Anaerolineales bacterium]
MNKTKRKFHNLSTLCLISTIFITSCSPQAAGQSFNFTPASNQQEVTTFPVFDQTPIPTRTTYTPGELVDYIAQTGDTVPALAARFNTTVEEIFQANLQIPRDATTM